MIDSTRSRRTLSGAVATALLLASCTTPEPIAPTPVATTPTSALTQKRLPPVSLGASGLAGGLAFGWADGAWRYDGPTGTLTQIDGSFHGPDGRSGFFVWRTDHIEHHEHVSSEEPQRTYPRGIVDVSLSADGTAEARVIRSTPEHLIICVVDVHVRGRTDRLDLCYPTADTVVRAVWPPDGRRLLLQRAATGANGRVGRYELFLYDAASGGAVLFYDPRARTAREGGPTSWVAARGWSPDGRYFAAVEWDQVGARGSPDEFVSQLVVFDVAAVRAWRLGQVPPFGFIGWGAPHALAYVPGVRWPERKLFLWNPETGASIVIADDEVVSPSWDGPGGKLVYVARAHGAMKCKERCGTEIWSFDLATHKRALVLRSTDGPVGAVRASVDGSKVMYFVEVGDDAELWVARMDGTGAARLLLFRGGCPPVNSIAWE